ncbi:MAG: acyltransferase [Bacteroidota bacterium]|nr:acyltransferase [Bacteroidota bacterium]
MDKEYQIQLDGFRFLAVSSVMYGHWVPYSYNILKIINTSLSSSGVNMFFVLSGFLITQILIKAKEQNADKSSNIFTLKQFYARRFLRIFPLYYLVVIAGYFLNIPTAKENISWYLTYSSNIMWSLTGKNCYVYTHLWSLAIEEQFYLFFPLLVLFTPKKHLLKAFIFIIFLAIFSRGILYFIFDPKRIWLISYGLTPCCFDCFGFGAILAYLKIYKPSLLESIIKKFYLFLISLLIFIILSVVRVFHEQSMYCAIFMRFTMAIFCFWLIGNASLRRYTGIAQKFLENKVIIYLGKISYGLYVYHYFMTYINSQFHIGENPLKYFILTILISIMSWHFYESPFNKLKKYFNYNK